MRFSPQVLVLGLAACSAAGPGFQGADPVIREVEGSRFTLRFRGGIAEAIRTNPEWMPRFPDIARKAALAAQAETACRAAWVEGDPAMMWIGLSCNGARAPKMPRRKRTLYCDLEDLQARGDLARGALTCSKR
ncbi:hypothetical protein [Pseudoponticoccus marisrubri]|uniref:Lipoprotein n=1 Tax=Pseudoponticoccus marisrubri TaxID=1685382 RepID=A0A0W7WG28_9RHOB|nr:hypothetical protein [Pseudoponticoccus marisrubri]KUF09438.1 hypothetical protein AVJ23_17505 [Pseudoponticoccus marisrubri]